MDIQPRELPLKERFKIARETWDSTHNLFVFVRYEHVWGVGEAGPAGRWQEDIPSAVAQLEGVDLGRLNGPFDLEGTLELLPPGSARCALDIALHDLAAKLAGVPLRDFLGLQDRPLPATSVTIGITDVDKMVERARTWADHPIIKVKVGFNGDVDTIRALREVFPNTIRIDANEGWLPEEAIERLQALAEFEIELCEQPIKAGNHEALAEITQKSSIPIFADEDVSDSKDVALLAGVVDGVNLKLRKTGGIREALRAVATARANGLRVMLGCDLDSGVQTSAQASIASLMDHIDLDGPMLLAEDPFPTVTYDQGHLRLPDGPGLGVDEALAP